MSVFLCFVSAAFRATGILRSKNNAHSHVAFAILVILRMARCCVYIGCGHAMRLCLTQRPTFIVSSCKLGVRCASLWSHVILMPMAYSRSLFLVYELSYITFGPISSVACVCMCFHIPNVLYELRNEFNLLLSFIPHRTRIFTSFAFSWYVWMVRLMPLLLPLNSPAHIFLSWQVLS